MCCESYIRTLTGFEITMDAGVRSYISNASLPIAATSFFRCMAIIFFSYTTSPCPPWKILMFIVPRSRPYFFPANGVSPFLMVPAPAQTGKMSAADNNMV